MRQPARHAGDLDAVARATPRGETSPIHAPARVRPAGVCRAVSAETGFNPRTRKGATITSSAQVSACWFQSTHPQGCDSRAAPRQDRGSGFNPRTRKGATDVPANAQQFAHVSIYAPARVRPKPSSRGSHRSCFNPRTRKGATLRQLIISARARVSIHAPARVRQSWASHDPRPGPGFNPRPRKGATGQRHQPSISRRSFNPRTRKGATRAAARELGLSDVSIHAPARVRQADPACLSRPWCFNPRTRKGATGIIDETTLAATFQSTHPQGCDFAYFSWAARGWVSIHAPARVRPDPHHDRDNDRCFNPRTRKGATLPGRIHRRLPAVSIHAPARVRLDRMAPYMPGARFQSTHPQGCDSVFIRCRLAAHGFNPRTRKGATLVSADHKVGSLFQSTHPQGCDGIAAKAQLPQPVSIHAPARVRRCTRPDAHDLDQFQSTHPQGCDTTAPAISPLVAVSIHAPARVRRSAKASIGRPGCFNPRTRKGATHPLLIS